SAVEIDLTDVAGYGVELLVVLDPGAALAVPAAHTLIDVVGDSELNSVHVVRGGGEDLAGLAYAQAPCVVGGGGHELEVRGVGLEPEDALAKPLVLSADLAAETGVPDGAPDPVVEAAAEVAGAGVGVLGAPTGEKDFADVGVVVALGGFQEQSVRGLRDDDATVGERDAGGNAQL